MPIQTPDNESAILPRMSKEWQAEYQTLKGHMNRVADKNPGMDTQFYTDRLRMGLNAAKERQEVLQGNDDPVIKKHRQIEIQNNFERRFDEKYPVFTRSSDPETLARVKQNKDARDRLGREVQGEGFGATVVNSVYDPEKGMKWGNIAGGGIGLLLGGLMGSYIAGAAGGGWLGLIATVLLAGAGAAFGVQVAEKLSAPTPVTPPAGDAKEPSAPGQGRAKEGDTPANEHDVPMEKSGLLPQPATPPVTDAPGIKQKPKGK